jgi:hypothetical protein
MFFGILQWPGPHFLQPSASLLLHVFSSLVPRQGFDFGQLLALIFVLSSRVFLPFPPQQFASPPTHFDQGVHDSTQSCFGS